MELDLIDEPIHFVENVEEQNPFLKPENKINLSDNIENSKFGQKIVSNVPIIIKYETISDVEVKKQAFNRDGRLLSSVNDILQSDGSIKRS